ncbi:hypothetical protein, partial [Propionibacterium freudenreichii]|uniref:hypothetical protein n=1 Tax=Propionibacterium freudenreichii TaxID=1744 RepID=UPI000A688284
QTTLNDEEPVCQCFMYPNGSKSTRAGQFAQVLQNIASEVLGPARFLHELEEIGSTVGIRCRTRLPV